MSVIVSLVLRWPEVRKKKEAVLLEATSKPEVTKTRGPVSWLFNFPKSVGGRKSEKRTEERH